MGELSPKPTLSPETCAQAACVCAPFGSFALGTRVWQRSLCVAVIGVGSGQTSWHWSPCVVAAAMGWFVSEQLVPRAGGEQGDGCC